MISTPDGKQVITSHRFGRIRRWDALSGQLLGEHQIHEEDPECCPMRLVVSPDGSQLACGQGLRLNVPKTDTLTKEIVLFDLATNEITRRWKAEHRKVNHLAFRPGHDELLSTGWDKVVRRWRISTAELITEYPLGNKNAASMHLLAGDETLVVIDSDGIIRGAGH